MSQSINRRRVYGEKPISPYEKEYLTIYSETEENTITWIADDNTNAKTIYWSIDKVTWNNATSSTSGTVLTTLVNMGDEIYIKGNNSTYSTSTYSNYFSSTGGFSVRGNIMSLMFSDSFLGKKILGSSYTFKNLFQNCPIIRAEHLCLPATSIGGSCYRHMFSDCTSLITAPEILPATTLISYCYYQMFYGCTSLTTVPELPATTLALCCYQEMFYHCTSLTTVPSNLLPATTLASNCYHSMFRDCVSLTTSLSLPSTTLAYGCYSAMFYGTNIFPDCTNIDFTSQTVVASGGLKGLFSGTKVTDSDLYNILPTNPSTGNYWLPVTTLSERCYQEMFYHCTSLTTAPELPATTLADYCYYQMFYNCGSLTTVQSTLPATTLTSYCYCQMFYHCTSLTTAPELPAATLVKSCYYYMFYGCTSLNYIKCLATDISATYCTSSWVNRVKSGGTFVKDANMTSWTTGVSGIPSGWTVQNA